MRERGGIAPTFLTLALDGDEWSASRPGLFTSGEIAPDTNWIGSWVGPRVVLDIEEEKNHTPGGNLTQAVQLVARRYTDWAIQTHFQ
jgi:hypothetical protein